MNETWRTESSHPWSRTKFQTRREGRGTLARITVGGREVVSPSYDTDYVYRQYTNRVQHSIEND